MKIIKKDILYNISKDKQTYILHGCNCFHIMGAGIAKYLVNKFPIILERDKQTKYGDINKLGNFNIIKVENNLFIVNCYTQYRYGKGKHFNIHALILCLLKLRHYFYNNLKYKINSDKYDIRSPLIGSGLGGGDINTIYKIYKLYFPEVKLYGKQLNNLLGVYYNEW